MLRLFCVTIIVGLASCLSSCVERVVTLEPPPGFTSIAKIALEEPIRSALSPDGRKLCVLSSAGRAATLVDIESNYIEHTFELGFLASFAAFSNDSRYVCIAGSDLKDPPYWGVVRLDTVSKWAERGILVDKDFYCVGGVFSPDGQRLYLSNVNGMFLTIIDPIKLKIIRKILLKEGGSFGVAISPEGSRLYVTHAFSRSISVIATKSASVVTVIRDVGKIPVAIALSQDGNTAYIVDNGEASITVVDTVKLEITGKIGLDKSSVFKKMGTPSKFSPYARVYFQRAPKQLMIWSPYTRYPGMVDVVKQVAKPIFPKEYEASDMVWDAMSQLFVFSRYKDGVATIMRRGLQP